VGSGDIKIHCCNGGGEKEKGRGEHLKGNRGLRGKSDYNPG